MGHSLSPPSHFVLATGLVGKEYILPNSVQKSSTQYQTVLISFTVTAALLVSNKDTNPSRKVMYGEL